MNQNNKVIVILGPTSSGKSGIAVELAREFNGEIISVDSRQIFKEMDLGTGKIDGEWNNSEKPPQSPFEKEGGSVQKVLNKLKSSKQISSLLKGRIKEGFRDFYLYKNIPHHLIDFVEPDGDYNVSHFKKDCEKKILEISEQGKVPILCGGTGFWIQAVADDVELPQIKPNKKLREKLATNTPKELFEMLEKIDPERASTIDKKNPPRLIRAIEIAKEIGKVPKIETFKKSSQRKIKEKSFIFLQIGISVSKDKLFEKIKLRLKKRFQAGMVEEILDLYEKYDLPPDKIQNLGIAYSLIPLYQKGELTRKELFEKIVQAEIKYAKRQMTWFKKDPRIFWINEKNQAKNKIEEFLN